MTEQTNSGKITWDKTTQEKFEKILEQIPPLIRGIAETRVFKKAQNILQQENRWVIGEKDMVDAFFAGDHDKAQKAHHKLFPLCRAMFVETNPIPIKKSMKLLGFCSDELRLPLVSFSEKLFLSILPIIKSI